MTLKSLTLLAALLVAPAIAQESDLALVGQLVAFHGSRAIVTAMTTHCYETTGLDIAYQSAADNWYVRNVGYLDLADKVIARLGGAAEGQVEAAQTYGGAQIMSAYNTAPDKTAFCRDFLIRVDSGALDLNQQLPAVLARAQAIAAQ